jgi:hypothetical protein
MKAKPATELILFLKITHTLKIVRGMSGKNLQKATFGRAKETKTVLLKPAKLIFFTF